MTYSLKYIAAYPEALQQQVRDLLAQGKLADYIGRRYPETHVIQTDKALYQYAEGIRQDFLRHSPRLDKVLYDSKLDVIHNALGLHSAISRQHGGRLAARKEIRIASVFRDAPASFLRMIVVHELAHLRELEHNKAFYQLCEHMQPGYHQLEFDMRLFLILKEQKKG